MQPTKTLQLGHSPDPDDAFMFYALAQEPPLIPTGRWRFKHVLQDIQTLNQRARKGELEITAISIHGGGELPLDSFLNDFSRRIAPKRLLVAWSGEHAGVSGWTALERGEVVEEEAREDGGASAIPSAAFDLTFGSRIEGADIDRLVEGTSGLVLAPAARAGAKLAEAARAMISAVPYDFMVVLISPVRHQAHGSILLRA